MELVGAQGLKGRMQQSVDTSADREVMAILSSPVHKFVVKPQPRTGGVAPGAGTLGPPSPRANGHHPPGLMPRGAGEYRGEGAVGVGRGLGSDAALAGSGGVGPGAGPSASPQQGPALPRAGKTSWDPHNQSSNSAFSVPAGRGVGVGGRGDGGAGGVGGGALGSAALGARQLGGFRVVGNIPGDHGSRGHSQDSKSLLQQPQQQPQPKPQQPQQGTDGINRRYETGGGRTPGPARSSRYPIDDPASAAQDSNCMRGVRDICDGDVAHLGADAGTLGGHHPLSYDRFGDGGARYDHPLELPPPGADGFLSSHGGSFGSSAGGVGEAGGGGGAVDASGRSNSRHEGGMPEVMGHRSSGSVGLDSGVAAAGAAGAGAVSASVATATLPAGAHMRAREGSGVGDGAAGQGQSLVPDNWGIMQYGLTLENPVAGPGAGVESLHGPVQAARQRPGEEGGGLCNGGVVGDGGVGNQGNGMGVDTSASAAGVAMMMDSLSLRNQSPSRGTQAPYRGGQQGTPRGDGSAALRFGGGVDGGEGLDANNRGQGPQIQVVEDNARGGDYGGGGGRGIGAGGGFGFLDARPPAFDPVGEERAQLRQQQQQQQQQSVPPPLHPRRAVGGSPSLGPQARCVPSRGHLDSGGFPLSPVAAAGGRDPESGTRGTRNNGTTGSTAGGGGAGTLRWSFPPPGMSGQAGGPGGAREGDGPPGGGAAPAPPALISRLDTLGDDVRGAVGGGDGGPDVDGRGDGRRWAGIRATPGAYGVPRRLMFEGETSGAGAGASIGGGGGGGAGGRGSTGAGVGGRGAGGVAVSNGGGGMVGGRGNLSGSIDGQPFAVLRGHQRGYQVEHHRPESHGGLGSAPGDKPYPPHGHHARGQHQQQYQVESRGGVAGSGNEYDYPPAYEGVEGVGARQGGRGPIVGGGGGGGGGGSGEVSVSADLGSRPVPPAGRRDEGGDAGVPPPCFPRGGYEYVDYGGAIEYPGGNEGSSLGDGRAAGHRGPLSQQQKQQQQQQQQQQEHHQQEQQHGGVPVPHPHPQASLPHEHLSAPGLRPPRDMRATATLVGGGMRPEPVEGGGWDRAGHARVVAGAGGAGEFDYADGFSSHRGGYEVGGHPPPPRHAQGYDPSGFDGSRNGGMGYDGAPSSGGGGVRGAGAGTEPNPPYDIPGASASGQAYHRFSRPGPPSYDGPMPPPPQPDPGYGGSVGYEGPRVSGDDVGGMTMAMPPGNGGGGSGIPSYGAEPHERPLRHRKPQQQQQQPQGEYQQHPPPPSAQQPPPQHDHHPPHPSQGYSPPDRSSAGSATSARQQQHPPPPQQEMPWTSSPRGQSSAGSRIQPPHYPHAQQGPKPGSWSNRMVMDPRERSGNGALGGPSAANAGSQNYGGYGRSPPGKRSGGGGGGPPPPIPTSQALPPGNSGGEAYARQVPTRMPIPGVQGRTAGVVGAFSLPSPKGKGRGGDRGMGASHPGLPPQQVYHEHPLQRESQQTYIGGTHQKQFQDLRVRAQQHPQQQKPQQQQQHPPPQQPYRDLSPGRGGMMAPPPAPPSAYLRSREPAVGAPGVGGGPGGGVGGAFPESSRGSGNTGPAPADGTGAHGSSPHRTPSKRLYGPDPGYSGVPVGRYGYGGAGGLDTGGGVGGAGPGDGVQRWVPPGGTGQGGYGRQGQQPSHGPQHGNNQTPVKGHVHHPSQQPPLLHHAGPPSGAAGASAAGGGGMVGSGGTMVPVQAAPMDEKQVKRAELVESPTTRLAFKDFYRAFRAKEKTSFHAAKVFAMECFKILPVKVHWRLYLEIADLARRENRFVEARKLYRKVTKLQPFASQGWVEYCKLEEEFGDLGRCSQILRRGLTFCEYSETLLIKAVKQEERAGNLNGARELLSRLKHVGIENVWRTVLEGALLEARSGNTDVARKVLKYLMTHVPWYGPIYYEAFRLEEKAEHFESALAIVHKGLHEIPRYGPLWFGAFRLSEKLDMRDARKALAEGQSPYEDLYKGGKVCTRAKETLEKAKDCISKELVWKVHFEAAQIEERFANVCAREVAMRSRVSIGRREKKCRASSSLSSSSGGEPSQGLLSAPAQAEGPGGRPGDGDYRAPDSANAGSSLAVVRIENRLLKLSLRPGEGVVDARGVGGRGDGDGEADEEGSKGLVEGDGRGVGGAGRDAAAALGGGIVTEAQARNSLLAPCRASYAHAVLTCPQNLRWKVWLAGARMELAAGNCSHAQRLLNRAFQEVPEKSKSHVFLECARLEEFTGNLECARQILERARVETKSEWKVFLESVLLEIRANDWQRAATEADAALRVHSGAGRLWAVLVQLKQRDSDEAQQASLKKALKEVPKSGEVWCEGARIHLNPLSKAFNLDTAGKYLGFAVQFTPQYGDSFMECLRLRLLVDLFLPKARAIADARERAAVAAAAKLAPTSPSRLLSLALEPVPVPAHPSTPNARAGSSERRPSSTSSSGFHIGADPVGEGGAAWVRRDGGGVGGSSALRSGDGADSREGTYAAAGPLGRHDRAVCAGDGGAACTPSANVAGVPNVSSPASRTGTAIATAQELQPPLLCRPLLSLGEWMAVDHGRRGGASAAKGEKAAGAGSIGNAGSAGGAGYAGAAEIGPSTPTLLSASATGSSGSTSRLARTPSTSTPTSTVTSTPVSTTPPRYAAEDPAGVAKRSHAVEYPPAPHGVARDGMARVDQGQRAPGECATAEGHRASRTFFELTAEEIRSVGRLTEGDLLRAEVEELLLRCVNADPNYGSMWFHCRHRPSDTAKSILMMAKLMMADELTKLQDVYLHAVTRHVILQREADAYIAFAQAELARDKKNGGGGGSSGAQASSAQVVEGTRLGAEPPAAAAASFAPAGGPRRRKRLHARSARGRRGAGAGAGCVEDWRERLMMGGARRASPVSCVNMEGDLKGISAEDFVTGLVSLNRITAQMGRLRSEDRRKILFGSDQIVP